MSRLERDDSVAKGRTHRFPLVTLSSFCLVERRCQHPPPKEARASDVAGHLALFWRQKIRPCKYQSAKRGPCASAFSAQSEAMYCTFNLSLAVCDPDTDEFCIPNRSDVLLLMCPSISLSHNITFHTPAATKLSEHFPDLETHR